MKGTLEDERERKTYHGQEPAPLEGRVNRPHDEDVLEVLVQGRCFDVCDGFVPQSLKLLYHALVLFLGPPRATAERHEQFVALEGLPPDVIVFAGKLLDVDETAVDDEPRRAKREAVPVRHGASQLRLLARRERQDMMKFVDGHDVR